MDGVQKDTIFERKRPPYPENHYQNEALYDLAAISAVLPPLSPALAADKGRKPKTVNQCSEAQEEGKEGERKRAQPVERPSDPVRERKPKAADYKWFERGKAEPNDSELLLFALIIVICASSAGELKEWASKVIKETAEATAAAAGWRPSKERWPTPARAASLIYEPLSKVFGASWTYGELDAVATAMQSWEGAGQIDVGHIKAYLNKKTGQPLGVPADKKTAPPPRWRTWAVVKVARLIVDHGPAFRRLLKLDAEAEPVPSASERIAAAKAEVAAADARAAKAEAALAAMQSERDRIANAHRMQHQRQEDAKEKAREKVKAAIRKHKEAAKETQRRRRAETKAKLEVAAKRKAEAAAADEMKKQAGYVSTARERARKVEGEAKGYRKTLKRAQTAEANVKQLRIQIDEQMEAQEEAPESPENDRPENDRRDERGRFQAEPWQHRVLEWAQLARGVSPSTINRNITEVLTLFASEAVVPLACERQMRKLRGEVTIAGEMIAALRVALCTRIISFGFDESTKFGLGLLSTNTQIEPHGAPGTSVDVVMRGVTLTAGGTAKEISKDIDEKLFAHARRLLTLWKDEHERMFGEGSWSKADMPSADNIGLHRLSENAVLMSDTCNAARATKRLVAEMAEKAGRERIGTEVWAKMTEEERELKVKCHLGDCHDHLRNIIIKAMATAATDYLKGRLGDDLDEFTSFDRMSVDPMESIRAACKELHPDGEYAKGKGRESEATRKRDHPSDLWLPIFNAVGNSRMDAVFDGAVPLYMDRLIICEFLHLLVHGPASKDNVLEKFLWRILESTEMVGLLRVCTLWQTLLTEPLRWLSGKSTALDDWSMVNSNVLLDETYNLMVSVAADGSALLDSTLDPFASIAATQHTFAAHRRAQQQQIVQAPDGTPHHVHMRTLQEARSPSTAGGRETMPITVELAQRMANAALVAMRDEKRAIADKLSSQDGANAANAAKSARIHEATKGAHVNNARVESHFGKADNLMRTYRRSTTENYAGMVQQAYNHDFDQPLNVASDRRKRKADEPEPSPSSGFFWSDALTDELRASLVSAVRKEAEHARGEGRKALAAHDASKLARREERLVTALNAAVDYFAYGKELFEAWSPDHGQSQAAKDAKAIDQAITGKPEAQQLEYLRHQIDMRVIGLGWDQFKTKWSAKSDATIGTVAHLRALLINDILPHERAEARLKRLPTEAAPPQFTAADIGQLGSANADALAIKSKAIFSAAELDAKAEAAVKRREAAGISDSVEAMQSLDPPPFDQQLVGKRVEVLWKYINKDTNEPLLIWVTGRITRVADGLTDARSKRAKALLPAGAVLWAWDADPDAGEAAGERWLCLLPKKWNPRTHTQVYSWRFDPLELSTSATAPERDPRRRNATRMEE